MDKDISIGKDIPGFILLLYILLFLGDSSLCQTWEFTGGPKQSIAYDILFTKSGRLISSNKDGIFYSDNFGTDWQPAYGSDSIYSFIQTYNGNLLAATPKGLIRSTNNGENWTILGSAGYNICQSPKDSSLLYIDGRNLFKSTDNGMGWTRIWSGDTASCLAVNDSGWIYVGVKYAFLMISKDNGKTFQRINTGYYQWFSGYDISNAYIYSSVQDHHGGIYLKINNPSILGDQIFLYDNKQLSLLTLESPWGLRTPFLNVMDNGNLIYQSDYHLQEYLYTLQKSQALFRLNQGEVQSVSKVEMHGKIWIIKFNNLGIYRSTDAGFTWNEIGQDYKQCLSVYVNPNGTIFTGVYSSLFLGGLYQSGDDGTSWINIDPQNHGGYYIHINSLKNGNLVAAGTNGLFIHDKINSYWIHPDNISYPNSQYVSKNGVIYVGDYYNGIFISRDNGHSWVKSDSSLQTSAISGFGESGTGRVFAAVWPSGVYYTDNNGLSWTPSTSDAITYTNVFDFAYKNDTIFAATSYGVDFSTDNGINWEQMYSLNQNLKRILAAPNGDLLTVGFNNKIYRSTDDGEKWADFDDGLSGREINDIYIDITGKIFVATDSGIYSTERYKIGPASNAQFLLVGQNFPNPFNSYTVVLFSIPVPSQVSLTVYNLLGQRVSVLFNKNFDKGNYRYTWDASKFSSGVYFLRLEGKGSSSTIKVLLMK